MEPDYAKVVLRVIELSGGKDKLKAKARKRIDEINDMWAQNTALMGRILRAHLFVEHYITECLKSINPNLNGLDNARLTFSQKLALLENYSDEIKDLAVGIKRLNTIRNRLGHNLNSIVTDQDLQIILSVNSFRELRDAFAKPNIPSNDAVDIIDDFAKHVGNWLESTADPNSLSQKFAQAVAEISKKT